MTTFSEAFSGECRSSLILVKNKNDSVIKSPWETMYKLHWLNE